MRVFVITDLEVLTLQVAALRPAQAPLSHVIVASCANLFGAPPKANA